MDNKFVQWNTAKWWTCAWSPMVGCHKISPACTNCWAEAWAKRFHQSFEPHPTKQKPPRKGIVFCGSMTDLAGEWRTVEDLAENIAECIMPTKKDAKYLWLTKRVKRMCDALHYVGDRLNRPDLWFMDNYFGFTAENQEWYEKRLEPFLDSFPKWAQAWVSAEPLLGHLGFMFQNPAIREKIRWVVVGCESGRNRRKCPVEFVEDVVDQCRRFNVPVFVKQLDLSGKCETDINKFPEHLRIRQVPWKQGVAATRRNE